MHNKKESYRKAGYSVWSGLMIWICLLCMGMGIYAMADYLSKELELKVNGAQQITIEYGQQYVDAGAAVWFDGKEIDQTVTTQGQVDPFALGEYTVHYTVSWGWQSAEAFRRVTVVDTQPPQITLTYGQDTYTEPGQPYLEEGYSAWDDVNGDLTDAVIVQQIDGVVIYTVSDDAGNITQVERTIIYDDRTPPTLELLGDDTITIMAGDPFKEPGFTAMDNVDGDITDRVSVSVSENITNPGEYAIHYSVSDGYGNTAEASRKLIVEELVLPEPEDPEGEDDEPTQSVYVDDSYLLGVGMMNDPGASSNKVIYLTFDDGPGAYTEELLEVLEKYNVKVTFFVVGSACLEYLPDIAERGHSIGLHANNHNYKKIYASDEAFWDDLNALQQKIFSYTGEYSRLYRFPGGSSNTVSKKYCKGIVTRAAALLEEEGYYYFDWNVDSDDAGSATTSVEVYNNVVAGIRGQDVAVVLQHDVKGYSVDAVEMIIQWGLANGYTFLALDESSPVCHHIIVN